MDDFSSDTTVKNLEYVTIGFDQLAAGTVVSDQFDGVTILAQRAEDGGLGSTSENDAMIFDTANPTGGDTDLATSTQGHVLIVSEDNDSTDPDDEAHGGSIQVTFENHAFVKDLNIIDTERGGTIFAYDESGALIKEIEIPTGADGEIRQVAVDVEDVTRLVIDLNSSGAIDDLRYVPWEDPVADTASLGGTYFMDANDNAVEDAGDMAVAGANVYLLDNSVVVAETQTDANGDYLFENLGAGTYQVAFALEDGKEYVAARSGDDETIDSDVLFTIVNRDELNGNGITGQIELAAGENKRNVDAGVSQIASTNASLGGTYFFDRNDNAVEDAGDEAVSGVNVYLVENSVVVAVTQTDENGDYLFENLDAGMYQVAFAAQDGKEFVATGSGEDDTADSDVLFTVESRDELDGSGITGQIEIAEGEARRNVDAGIVETLPEGAVGAIEGRVFCDEDMNGIDGTLVTGLDVEELIVNGGFSSNFLTGKNYGFAQEIQGWFATKDKIEVQTADYQTGNTLGNAVVELDGKAGNATIVQTVDVPEAGTYCFSIDYAMRRANADTNGVAIYVAGELVAELRPTEPGFQTFQVFLDLEAGAADVEIQGIGTSDTIGTVIDNVSLKPTSPASPASGKQGVTVQLIDADGAVVATTLTDADGNYRFDEVIEGDYTVMFVPLDGMEFTLQDAGTDDKIDSDVSADGKTGAVTVVGGETTSDVDAGLKTTLNISVTGAVCADKLLTINVLADGMDPASTTITDVAGQPITEGQTINVDGVNVTLQDGALTFDGETAFADLNVGEMGEVSIAFGVSDETGGRATGTADLTFKGVADDINEMYASLPTITTYQVLGDDLDGDVDGIAYSIIISDTGDARFDGKVFEQAYCISISDPVVYAELAEAAPQHQGAVLAGDNVSLFNADQISFANGLTAGENLDLINWIINQDYTADDSGRFNDWEVQRAIWELTDRFDTDALDEADSGYGQGADVDYIVQQAIENGEGFVAGKGDIATMIIDPGSANEENTQPFIVAFDFDENNCVC